MAIWSPCIRGCASRPSSPAWRSLHIFRFAAGKIVEMWDIGQQPPDEMINERGMF